MIQMDVTKSDVLQMINDLEAYRGFTKVRDDQVDEQIRLLIKMIDAIDVMKEVT
jgi:hypothetical protein